MSHYMYMYLYKQRNDMNLQDSQNGRDSQNGQDSQNAPNAQNCRCGQDTDDASLAGRLRLVSRLMRAETRKTVRAAGPHPTRGEVKAAARAAEGRASDALTPEELATTLAALDRIVEAFGGRDALPYRAHEGRGHRGRDRRGFGFGPRGFGRDFDPRDFGGDSGPGSGRGFHPHHPDRAHHHQD